MTKTGKKTGRAIFAAALAACVALSAFAGYPAQKAGAATKRTAVAETLLLSSGRINPADWETVGNAEAFAVTNNGSIFEFAAAPFPGNRIMAYDPIAAGKGFSMYFDVIKTDAAAAKLNLSGMTEGVDYGAKSNVFMSSLGLDPGAGTDWTAADFDRTIYTPDGSAVSEVSNVTLEAGYRYVFTMRPNAEDPTRGDFLFGKAKISELNGAEVQEQSLIKKLLHIDNAKEHYAHLYAETTGGAVAIDNFLVKDSDGAVKCDLDFSDASKISGSATPVEGGIYCSGGGTKYDTYLTLNSPAAGDRLVTYLPIEKDDKSEDAVRMSISVRLDGAAGKAGVLFGMEDGSAAVGAENTSFLYFERGETTDRVNVQVGSKAGTAQDLGVALTDFTRLDVAVRSNGTLTVSVGGEVKATFTGCAFEGYIGLMTDGTAGAQLSFLPELKIDTYVYVEGAGKNLENNFDSGWLNENNYIKDGHPATTLGAAGNDVVLQDGILLFDGTSDGTHFAFHETYADFILQFDWINYPWEDRPTKEDGSVYNKPKPAEGRGVELYSPLGISFGKTAPSGGWTENYLIRLFDDLNIVQEIKTGNIVTMGSGFANAEQAADIQPGKIDFYENTVNIKLVVRNNEAQVWGAVHNDPAETPEHKLLATFAVENYMGYVSISTTEAGYFGIDNLRMTNIDGWTDEQVSAYENYKEIAAEEKPDPVQLETPVLTLNDKTVTWNEVEHAAGYEVYVNGEKQGETIHVCTFTFEETEAGTYRITVKALGDGDLYLDSAESAAQEIVITEQGGNKPDPTPDPGEGGCDCGGQISAVLAPAAVALLGAAAFLLRKKRG